MVYTHPLPPGLSASSLLPEEVRPPGSLPRLSRPVISAGQVCPTGGGISGAGEGLSLQLLIQALSGGQAERERPAIGPSQVTPNCFTYPSTPRVRKAWRAVCADGEFHTLPGLQLRTRCPHPSGRGSKAKARRTSLLPADESRGQKGSFNQEDHTWYTSMIPESQQALLFTYSRGYRSTPVGCGSVRDEPGALGIPPSLGPPRKDCAWKTAARSADRQRVSSTARLGNRQDRAAPVF